jgi:hypothetical protein
MPDTAMAVAFTEAGYTEPEQRLTRIAIEAWGKWPQQAGAGARRQFVQSKLDPLTLVLFHEWQPNALIMAIGQLLNRTKQEIADEAFEQNAAKAAGSRPHTFETHTPNAQANPPGEQPADDGGRGNSDAHGLHASVVTPSTDADANRRSGAASVATEPTPASPPAANLTELADKHATRAAQRLQIEQRLSRLDTVMIDGKPIGDCTVAEVRDWATRRGQDARDATRDARFALSLVANLPSNAVIRDWWKRGEEVDEIYQRAEISHAA